MAGEPIKSELQLDVETATAKLNEIDQRQARSERLISSTSDRVRRTQGQVGDTNRLVQQMENRVARLGKSIAKIGVTTLALDALGEAGLESSFFGRLAGNVLTGAAFNPLNPAAGAATGAVITVMSELLRGFRELLKSNDELRQKQEEERRKLEEFKKEQRAELQKIEAQGRAQQLRTELQAIPERSEIVYQAMRALAQRNRRSR